MGLRLQYQAIKDEVRIPVCVSGCSVDIPYKQCGFWCQACLCVNMGLRMRLRDKASLGVNMGLRLLLNRLMRECGWSNQSVQSVHSSRKSRSAQLHHHPSRRPASEAKVAIADWMEACAEWALRGGTDHRKIKLLPPLGMNH